MKRKLISYLMGVVFIATLFNWAHFVNNASALDCKNINLVFSRGSSQNFPNTDNSDLNYPDWSVVNQSIVFKDKRKNTSDNDEQVFVTTESESAKFFKTIGDRVIKDFPTLTMQFVSLHDFTGKYNQNGYKAVSSFGALKNAYLSKNAVDARFGYSSIIADTTNDNYRQSVADGADELAQYLADEALRCPNQLTVLGGFSQGAQVVGEALATLHSQGKDQLLSRLGHVDLFGDPRFNGFELTTNRLSPLTDHVTYPWVRGLPTVNHVGILGPHKPYVPDVLTAQTTSWCDFNDVICGGYAGLGVDLEAHAHVYKDSGGWLEKNGGETYVAIKKRLALLAGLKDTSANSPFAYWPDIKKPTKLDVMFVMDATGDENLSLVPDGEYLTRSFLHLTDHTVSDDNYSSIHAGVVTYTEYNKFNGTADVVEPSVKTPVTLTDDLYSNYSYFKTAWDTEHFGGNNQGGYDQQDSPFSAINTALDQPAWRKDARKVIVTFSNSWGKSVEPVTGFTEKTIAAKAKSKKIEILPVFTSKTMFDTLGIYADQPLNEARTFWSVLAKDSRAHYTEVQRGIDETLVYDVIMNHTFGPDPVITLGKVYKDPKTKAAASDDQSGKKITVKKGTKLTLSAAKSSSPKSKIKTYAWDLNGDGIPDVTSDTPLVDHTFDDDFDGTITLTVTDENGTTQTIGQDVSTTDDGTQITIGEGPEITTPQVTTVRDGNDLVLTWAPTQGTLVFTDLDGALQFTVNASAGTFRLHDIPKTAFTLLVQLKDGTSAGQVVPLQIGAATSSGMTSTVGAGSGGAGTTDAGAANVDDQQAQVQGVTTSADTTNGGENSGGNVTAGAGGSTSGGAATKSVNDQGSATAGITGKSTTGVALIKLLGNLGRRFLGGFGQRFGHAKTRLMGALVVLFQSLFIFILLLLLLLLLAALLAKDRRDEKYQANKRKRFLSRRAYSV